MQTEKSKAKQFSWFGNSPKHNLSSPSTVTHLTCKMSMHRETQKQINISLCMHNVHTLACPMLSNGAGTVIHGALCNEDCGQAARDSLAESLIDWDKGLLMRQIAHQAGTTCFSDVTPFQTSSGAHRRVCVCASMCVCPSVFSDHT